MAHARIGVEQQQRAFDMLDDSSSSDEEDFDFLNEQYLRRVRNNAIIFKVCMIFMIQCSMLYALCLYYYQTELLQPDGFPMVLLIYMCCFIIHFNMQPRTLAAIERLDYLFLHPEKFENVEIPMAICFMKLASEMFVEVTCVFTTYYTYDLLYIVENYSALMVISYIDQEYYGSLYHPLKDKLDADQQFRLPKTNRKISNVKRKLTSCQMGTYGLIRIFTYLYNTIYIYFMPYIAIVLYEIKCSVLA